MDPTSILLIVLALAGIWALVELALVLRRARTAVDGLDRAVEELQGTVTEARPVVAKLDGVVDELQPAIAQVEPLLRQANVAVEALAADLVEVNGVLRDVSHVTGTVSTASGAVSSLTDAAQDKVSRLFGRRAKHAPTEADRTLTEPAEEAPAPEPKPEPVEDASGSEAGDVEPAPQYYTYGAVERDAEESHE